MHISAGDRVVGRAVVAAFAAVALLAVYLSMGSSALAGSAAESIDFKKKWFVSVEDAHKLIVEGAIVIDTREKRRNPLPNAVPLGWMELSAGPKPPKLGLLNPDDAALTSKLQSLGVSSDNVVLTVGDPVNGWGEEGRIAWTLRILGHPRTAVVDGGYAALVKRGLPKIQAPAKPGNFTVKRKVIWEIDLKQARQMLSDGDVVFLDTREPREFEGSTPYGESRGGHVPGAKHLYYKDLMDKEGRVLSASAISKKLAELGIDDKTKIVAYCSGGVRSAFATSVLQDRGYDAVNYTGSMWEWAAGKKEEFPLEK